MDRRISILTPGPKARLHAAAIYVLAQSARPFRYRGVQRLTWQLARFIPGEHKVAIRVSDDTSLVIPLGDGYWTKLLNRHFIYEPELVPLFGRLLNRQTYFLDCGANIGYWALLVRNRSKAVVAVEASPTTFQRLRENIERNSAHITLVHAAIWHTDGDALTISHDLQRHAGAAITATSTGTEESTWQSSQVKSVTIETLIETYCPDISSPIVIKLDVEGAEIPAIQGAREILRKRKVTLVYEDHGADPACKVSRYLQNQGLVTADAISGEPLTIDQISRQKTHKWCGYNFLAFYP